MSGREGGGEWQGIGDAGRVRPFAQRRRIFRAADRGPDLDELRLKAVEQKSRPFRSLVTADFDFSSFSPLRRYYAPPARRPAANNPHQARGRRRMMKRGSPDEDDKATTRSGTHKRRRQLQPLPVRGSPEPPSRSTAIDRVSAWLDCLPESPRSLASSDAVDKPQDKTIFDPPSSLSSNPNKPRSQNYRAQVLRRLEIRVDADASDEVRQRLLPPIQDGGLNEERIGEVARELYESARELLDRAAVNDEWTQPLSRAIQSLMRDKPDQLCCLPDRGTLAFSSLFSLCLQWLTLTTTTRVAIRAEARHLHPPHRALAALAAAETQQHHPRRLLPAPRTCLLSQQQQHHQPGLPHPGPNPIPRPKPTGHEPTARPPTHALPPPRARPRPPATQDAQPRPLHRPERQRHGMDDRRRAIMDAPGPGRQGRQGHPRRPAACSQ